MPYSGSNENILILHVGVSSSVSLNVSASVLVLASVLVSAYDYWQYEAIPQPY